MRLLISAFILAWSTEALAIAGGQESAPEEAPWAAALIDTSLTPSQECLDSGGSEPFCQQYCGGVLIAPDWALTAAHCLAEREVADIRVLLGDPDLNGSGYDQFAIAELDSPVDIQDLRNEVTYQEDIALLHLSNSSAEEPASLASPALLTDLENRADTLPDPVSILGWGQLHDNGAFPSVLRQVNYNLRPETLYPDDCAANDFFNGTTMICASEPDAAAIEPDDTGDPTPRDPYGEGSCEKDSGGPMVHHEQGAPHVVGLASWGLNGNCGDPAYPDVFTRVPYYLDFIENASAGNTSKALTGPNLINPAVTIDAPTTINSDNTTITVTLENQSLVNNVADAAFTLTWSGDGSVSSPASQTNLSCSSGTDSFTCTHNNTSLPPGGSGSADFPVTGLTQADTSITLDAEAGWSSGQDYRNATGSDRHRIARTTRPDLQLEVDGVVPEALQDGGQLWVHGRVRNASGSNDASDVTLSIEPPSDHVLADWPDSLSCNLGTTPTTCTVATSLPAGDQVGLGPLRLDSAGRQDGTLNLSVSATDGDFPARDLAGEPDTQASRAVTYPSPPPTSDTSSGSESGSMPDGGAPTGLLLVLSLLGVVRRRARGG